MVPPVPTGVVRDYTARTLFKADHPKRPEAVPGESVGQWSMRVTASFKTLTVEEVAELEEQASLLNSTRKELASEPRSEYLRGK